MPDHRRGDQDVELHVQTEDGERDRGVHQRGAGPVLGLSAREPARKRQQGDHSAGKQTGALAAGQRDRPQRAAVERGTPSGVVVLRHHEVRGGAPTHLDGAMRCRPRSDHPHAAGRRGRRRPGSRSDRCPGGRDPGGPRGDVGGQVGADRWARDEARHLERPGHRPRLEQVRTRKQPTGTAADGEGHRLELTQLPHRPVQRGGQHPSVELHQRPASAGKGEPTGGR